MAADLEQATRIDGREGRYSAALPHQWEIWGPNGGYLAALATGRRRVGGDPLATGAAQLCCVRGGT